MRLRARIVITALIAATAVAALATSASARNLSVSNQFFRVKWTSLELVPSFGATVRCLVTLEGSFHSRTITKSVGTLIGYVTRALVGRPCTNGQAWAYNGIEELGGVRLANTLPWHVTYRSFTGTLPNITALTIGLNGARFLIEQAGLRCNYTATAANGAPVGTMTREAGGAVNNLIASSGAITSETAFCPTGRFTSRAEDGTITLLEATTRITVTLI